MTLVVRHRRTLHSSQESSQLKAGRQLTTFYDLQSSEALDLQNITFLSHLLPLFKNCLTRVRIERDDVFMD
jgi:hypothetical protein